MRFYRLPGWVSQTICQLFPRRYCCRQNPFVHHCNCRAPKPVQLRVDMLESRESPTSLAGPNPLASLLNTAALTSLAAAKQDGFVEPFWHSPTFELSMPVRRISNPSYESNTSQASASIPAQGLGDPSTPRSGDIQNSAANWAAFSSSDFFPDQFAVDFPLLAKPPAGGSDTSPLSPGGRRDGGEGAGGNGAATSPSSACCRTLYVLKRITSASSTSGVSSYPCRRRLPNHQHAIEHIHLAADGFDIEFLGHVLMRGNDPTHLVFRTALRCRVATKRERAFGLFYRNRWKNGKRDRRWDGLPGVNRRGKCIAWRWRVLHAHS